MLFDGDPTAEPPLWPHQQLAIDRINFALASGLARVCLQLPTGGGKSRVAEHLARERVRDAVGVVIYTNRRMLMEQLVRDFDRAGIPFGIRADGYSRVTHHPL